MKLAMSSGVRIVFLSHAPFIFEKGGKMSSKNNICI
jgi:hypothetical protein